MFSEDSEEKIFLIEPLFSDYYTQIKSSQEVSFGLIEVSFEQAENPYNNSISYINKIEHKSKIKISLEPFKYNDKRLFLFIYPSNQGFEFIKNKLIYRFKKNY